MNINVNSWHCRLHDAIFDRWSRPQSLCPYFWKTVFCCFLVFLAASLFIFMFTVTGMDLSLYLFASVGITSEFIIWPASTFIGAIMFASIGSVLFGIIYGLSKIKITIKNKINDKRYKKYEEEFERKKDPNYVPPKTSVLIEYIRSRKEKFCPHIDFIKE